MKKLLRIVVDILIILIYTAVYVALTEKISLLNVLVGFAISLLALVITHKIMLPHRYSKCFRLNWFYVVYVLYLFFIIIKSALVSLAYVFTKNIGINMIPFKTKLKDENLKSMLANAITLTPGTVTADIKGDTIEVMKLCKLCKLDQTVGFVRIEKLLLRMDRN